ncbi:MAG: pantetheine-phosphate adenylyltransferase [Bdellovibrionales bacterium]|nr:pantetheine-phosphate adenylyltransferase [Bdellovibrionales bacterium]
MIKVIYPGSFDPITNGHVDIIQRLHPVFDEVVVLVADSLNKKYMFSSKERFELCQKSLEHLPGVKVDVYDGLTVDYAKNIGAKAIVRGIRAVSDFEHESAIANINKSMAPDIETFIVLAKPELSYVASRLVKEIAVNGGKLTGLVPTIVEQALKQKINK